MLRFAEPCNSRSIDHCKGQVTACQSIDSKLLGPRSTAGHPSDDSVDALHPKPSLIHMALLVQHTGVEAVLQDSGQRRV